MGCKDNQSSWSIGFLGGTRRKLWCFWVVWKSKRGSNEILWGEEDKKKKKGRRQKNCLFSFMSKIIFKYEF